MSSKERSQLINLESRHRIFLPCAGPPFQRTLIICSFSQLINYQAFITIMYDLMCLLLPLFDVHELIRSSHKDSINGVEVDSSAGGRFQCVALKKQSRQHVKLQFGE